MITLLKPFFRAKLKLILSIIIFASITICASLALKYKVLINEKIVDVENNVNNREYSLITDNENIIAELSNNNYIEKIDYIEINEQYYVQIIIKDISYIDDIDNYLRKENVVFSLTSNENVDELDVYQSTELLFNIFLVIIAIFIMIIVYVQIKLIIIWDTNNIMLLKVLGYNEYRLLFLSLFKVSFIILTAGAISLFIILLFMDYSILTLSIFSSIASFIILIIQAPILFVKIKKIIYIPY